MAQPKASRAYRSILSATVVATASFFAWGGSGYTAHGLGSASALSAVVAPLAIAPAPITARAAAPVRRQVSTRLASVPLAQRAGALAVLLGKPKRLMVGLGTTSASDIQAQALAIDINDQYLADFGTFGHYSWDKWGSGGGSYVAEVAAHSDRLGALPMFTLYQMATWGDGNIWGVQDKTFMKGYWDNVRLMYRGIKAYGKPVLINFEPDFWGYAQRQSADPTRHAALVGSVNPDCVTQPNSLAGFAQCLLQMARIQAPNAYVGFPPSGFGDLAANELNYMLQLGADQADFVVMQTLDRDAGCYEAQFDEGSNCNRLAGTPFYYDVTRRTLPNFSADFAIARSLHVGLGLPLIWWQTPLGVPSTQPGGTRNAFRDNRAEYFLTHGAEVVAAGGMGLVFSAGHPTQTNITTDGGQFRRLLRQYRTSPTPLP